VPFQGISASVGSRELSFDRVFGWQGPSSELNLNVGTEESRGKLPHSHMATWKGARWKLRGSKRLSESPPEFWHLKLKRRQRICRDLN